MEKTRWLPENKQKKWSFIAKSLPDVFFTQITSWRASWYSKKVSSITTRYQKKRPENELEILHTPRSDRSKKTTRHPCQWKTYYPSLHKLQRWYRKELIKIAEDELKKLNISPDSPGYKTNLDFKIAQLIKKLYNTWTSTNRKKTPWRTISW